MHRRETITLLLVAVLSAFLLGSTTVINLATQVTGTLSSVNGGWPSGMIGFIASGTCPTGWTQQSLSGDYLLMTVAANGDVGTTGGSLTSGGTSAGTPAGTNGTASLSVTGTKFTTSSSGTAAATLIGGLTVSTSAGNATVPAETFTGTAMGTHTHTIQPSYVKLIACAKN